MTPDDDTREFAIWLQRLADMAARRRQKEPWEDAEANQSDLDMRSERWPRIERCLNQMPPEHRAVLVLKDMQELKYQQIASILNVPLGTVRSRLHQARLQLAALLGDDDGLAGAAVPRP